MEDFAALRAQLHRLDGQRYGAYRSLRKSRWDHGDVSLEWHHVQGDPFASPSRTLWTVSETHLNLAPWAKDTPDSRRASADFFQRRLYKRCQSLKAVGQGQSGRVSIGQPGQEILERSGVHIDENGRAYCRLSIGLPANGRRIRGHLAAGLVCETIPSLLRDALTQYETDHLQQWVESVADQVALRHHLASKGLVAFIGDTSVLARRSGRHDEPMKEAVPIHAPDSLAVHLDTPHRGMIRGLGIPTGVTLIVGGGYHGKSTLLSAISRGIYDHIPGDGRALCVTREDAVFVRAEDGRAVRGVDISALIGPLPDGRDTTAFYTDDASGSTSQAAAIVEAMELGAQLLLMDEDTTATNFMMRDERMRTLVPAADEPIIPFIDRIGELNTLHDISTIMVVGGAGAYLSVADTVIRMAHYQAIDATADALAIVGQSPPLNPTQPPLKPWGTRPSRTPCFEGMANSGKRNQPKIRPWGSRGVEVGSDQVDCLALTQLVDEGQLNFLADIIKRLLHRPMNSRLTMNTLTQMIDEELNRHGVSKALSTTHGNRARVRRFEVAALLNRLPGLRIKIAHDEDI
ncbi:MAG: ABC-ATPase domain-containing protein [Myxococcota bacterium]|nr:ABC-ATPase domain-containing protein [Myxococcota bacterium]